MNTIELYCDLPVSKITEPETVNLIHGTPLTGLRVAAQKSTGEMLLGPEEMRAVRAAYPNLVVRPVLWPRVVFSTRFLAGFYDADLLNPRGGERRTGALPVLDVEHQAKRLNDRLALARRLDETMPYGSLLTTHPWHPEASKAAIMSQFPLEVQALSTSRMVERYGPRGRPGALQRFAVEKGMEARGEVPALTLPLYGQKKLGGMRAMETAVRAARGLRVTDISYWSLKWLLRNAYAREFLSERLPELLRTAALHSEEESDG